MALHVDSCSTVTSKTIATKQTISLKTAQNEEKFVSNKLIYQPEDKSATKIRHYAMFQYV